MAKKKIARQKITGYGINYEIIPEQVSDVINVDTSNIETCKAKIKQQYSNVATAAEKVNKAAGKAMDSKAFAGKSLQILKDIQKYTSSQKKLMESRSASLDKQIKADVDDMNAVVDSATYTNEIMGILNSTSSTNNEKALATAMLGFASTSIASTGYTLNADGTYTNGNHTYKLSDDKSTLVRTDTNEVVPANTTNTTETATDAAANTTTDTTANTTTDTAANTATDTAANTTTDTAANTATDTTAKTATTTAATDSNNQ